MDICIILNTIVFMLHYHRESRTWEKTLNYLNYFFVLIFFFEIMIKFIMYDIQHFVREKW